MLSLVSQTMVGRRILIIEDEVEPAAALRRSIMAESGVALGPVPDIEEALRYIHSTGQVDCVMLDTRLAVTVVGTVNDVFLCYGIETIFVTGHDDWFDGDADDFYAPAQERSSAY